MPPGWAQNGDGQAQMVSLLPGILDHVMGEDCRHPDVLFTDRGPGFYHPSTGTICPEYVAALQAHGFKAWAGDHSKWQPPDLADILLHETAVAWVRKYSKHQCCGAHQHLLRSGGAVQVLAKEAEVAG